jgi:hypothetical protein
MPQTHTELSNHYISRLQIQLSQLQSLAQQSTMHTSFLSAAVASLLAISVSAAPTSSQPHGNIQQAHLPGSPHGPGLHPSASASSAGTSSASPSSDSSSSGSSASSLQSRSDTDLEERSQDLQGLKDLVLEIKRDGWTSGNTDAGNEAQEDDGENHATYMLGSPVSFPARGGQGGRDVA